jgi:hypothetical protein
VLSKKIKGLGGIPLEMPPFKNKLKSYKLDIARGSIAFLIKL